MQLEARDFCLSRIAVAPVAQGRGFGTILLREYARLAEAAGQTRLALEVSSTATRAMALYLGNGFVESGRHRVDDPETGRALEYVRRLAME
jgi:ribosomal protein S18 acetylase RimI-like enzyme